MAWIKRRAWMMGVAFVVGGVSGAQALDCTKANSIVERAICAAPALMEQDTALAKAYADKLAADPTRIPALRAEQRAWLTQRERLCGAEGLPPPRVTACLTGLYRSRLVALAAAGPTPPVPVPAPRPAGQPPVPGVRPTLAVPVAVTDTAPLPVPPAPSLPTLPTSRPTPDAALARATAPAQGAGDVLLTVREPGRFAIRAESRTGVALQLVDMITGPGDQGGEAGAKDGRIDALLDRGTYKLRTIGAPSAPAEAKLSVMPFREAGDVTNALVFGGETTGALSDLGQLSAWVAVDKAGHVAIEAVGRSLGDLRLWRNGTDLSELTPRLDRITPKAGHTMTRARLSGDVEPGLYLATAYGGPKLAWADNDPSEPLYLRVGLPEPMVGGWIEGVIGAIGSARFEAPGGASSFRLELPDPAPATLSIRRGSEDGGSATIAKNSREPVARLDSPTGETRVVEVTGEAGQPFRLRALDPAASRRISGAGPHWIAVDVAGEGADEIPATIVLAQLQAGKSARVVAANAPQIGPGRAWRQKLNFRGPSSLLFEVTAATPVGLSLTGLRLTATIAPLLGNTPLRTDGKTPRWDLDPGWYELKLAPLGGAFGVVDVTLGPPGISGEPKPGPSRPSIPLGIQGLERGGNYQVYTNAAPNLVLAPRARPMPARLDLEPLALYQEAGQSLDIPVRAPARGFLAATGVNGVAIPVSRGAETTGPNGRTTMLRLPPPERGRGLILSWSDPATRGPAPVLPPISALESVAAGTPRFFDLGRGETKSFALDVAEGGLYRVETLGRLHTDLSIATSFLPKLDSARANGAGENALAQTYLRAGRYNVVVKASDSNGRVGLAARSAALTTGGTLTPESSVRASLADGAGVIVPIEIAEAGRYHLDLYALGEPFRARLEDEAGWPLTVPGPTNAIERQFEPGRYRLVVLLKAVDARVVARLSRVVPAVALVGHGPHPLAFDQDRVFQWREPAGVNDPRVPDRWEFALAGPADINLDLTPGMTGDLLRIGEDKSLGRIVPKAGYAGRLPAGRYAVEARSLGRNDRLDYTISLKSREIQPNVARRIQLPATIPFAIAEDRVVSLTSFGRTDLRGVLKDGEGRVIERLDDRTNDWNIGLSRHLGAGAYTLELSAVDPGPAKPAPIDDTSVENAATEAPSEPEVPDTVAASDEATPALDTPPDQTKPDDEDEDSDDDEPDAEVIDTGIEIRFALPEPSEHPALTNEASASASGGAVHRFALPAAPAGGLLMAAARSQSELVLSLERADAAGGWSVVGFERGTAPLVAAPADGEARPWRVSLWAVDGGPARMEVASRVVTRDAASAGAVALAPVPFGPVAPEIRVARIAAPSSGVMTLQTAPAGLLEGSVPGHALQPLTDRIVVPQTESSWIVACNPGQANVALAASEPPRTDLALTVPAEGRATFPKSAAPSGQMRIWRADSTFGQPGLQAGRGFGVAPGSAVAAAGDAPLRLWNAGGVDPLGLRVAAIDLALRPDTRAEPDYAAALPKGTAQPVTLAAGRKRLTLDLAAGTGAILGQESGTTTIWSGSGALSRTLDGDWTRLVLVNLAPEARPVRAMMAPLPGEPLDLAAGGIVKSFFGAAGSLSLRAADAKAGDRLVVAGADATFIGADGRVARGTSLALSGPGEIVLDHAPGLLAAWIERPGRSPWPQVDAKSVSLPSTVPLAGTSMALALKQATAMLLHARTNAPVILSLAQDGQDGAPVMFPAGAEFHRLVAAGDATLRLYSPHDGPLSGALELTASPVTPAGEGIGDATALAPGGTALFSFEVKRRSAIGIGVRAEPDMTMVRLLDAAGRSLGSGVAQLQTLDPGRYVVEASVPADGRTTVVRPAIIGIAPPPSGPPQDVIRDYMQLVGLAPTAPTR